MDTRQVVARFEAERQALALMDHPGIAKVLDAGTTARGLAYFAMEHVHGEPLTTYCDRHRLSTADRLQLFMHVCDAVQHAHQKGVIHRDLKPSNVLVAILGDQPVPKIIDFGIAKATAQRLTEQTVFTELGVLIGTPEYMSPEQAEMTGLDIDTRTDVYSLGVMLYTRNRSAGRGSTRSGGKSGRWSRRGRAPRSALSGRHPPMPRETARPSRLG
jgi:serine/threonine protein kinase